MNPVTVGVVGIHGYAKSHLNQLLDLQERRLVRDLTAVAHAREQDPAWAAELERRGLRMVPDLDALLATPGIELVTIPVGIHLHVAMTEAVLARGLAAFLEKPVAGCLADVDRLARNPRADRLLIGYQHLFVPGFHALRRRLADGEFGRVRKVVVTAGWPRDKAYYARARWAGQLTVDGITVRDSPANNACAHYLNLALFLCGSPPVTVRAALARANPIPSFDTCGLRVGLADGGEIIFNASHAGTVNQGVRLRLECERAVITCPEIDSHPVWPVSDGTVIEIGGDIRQHTFLHAVQHLRGLRAPVCTMADARGHARVIETAHRAPIVDLPAQLIEDTEVARRCVAMAAALDDGHARGITLDATGLLPGLVAGPETACPP